jgi:predicted metal-dependent enzyme (double-stranded beta helix superfamily)
MFDLERFVDECHRACAAGDGVTAVRELLAAAVADPAAVLAAVGEPARAGVQTLHRSPALTVLNVIWGPRMSQIPHDHEMWAVIGIYTGREDNIFWRRRREPGAPAIEAAGARAMLAREAVPLGRDIIHSVLNPIGRLTGAIHVYGGDFFGVPRREWDPECLAERPYDLRETMARFEESNRFLSVPREGGA